MSSLIPSFIVLGSLLITLVIMLRRAPDLKAGTIVTNLIMTALCFVGGMLISAMYTRAVGNESSNPFIISVLVAMGTFGALAIYIKLDEKQKRIIQQRKQQSLQQDIQQDSTPGSQPGINE
jgi:predicted DNA repair protein MutK